MCVWGGGGLPMFALAPPLRATWFPDDRTLLGPLFTCAVLWLLPGADDLSTPLGVDGGSAASGASLLPPGGTGGTLSPTAGVLTPLTLLAESKAKAAAASPVGDTFPKSVPQCP